MPRKPKPTHDAGAQPSAKPVVPAGTAASAEPTPDRIAARDADLSAEPLGPNEKPKSWGPPYKPIYSNTEKGFELGEDRRFKQRVFKFNNKPDETTRQILKEAGFRYRPEDQAWTVQADAATRELSDRLARQFAGESRGRQ